ncbi:MAG: homoserine dehydrogenase, partial [Candidatus Omnitrophica bacterium]|nr:homoserine dehydrogenase [Candidatus Omnitrophota bacterium]
MAEKVGVGLVGFGVVGTGMVSCLLKNSEQIDARSGIPVVMKTIADLDITTPRSVDTTGIRLTQNIDDILNDPEIDVVVELVGGTDFAYNLIVKILEAGKDVVTANKALLARHGAELFVAADEAHRDVIFEASVGGGIPIIRTLREGLAA